MAVSQYFCTLLLLLLISICVHESMAISHYHNVCYSGPHGCHDGIRNGWLLSCQKRYLFVAYVDFLCSSIDLWLTLTFYGKVNFALSGLLYGKSSKSMVQKLINIVK